MKKNEGNRLCGSIQDKPPPSTKVPPILVQQSSSLLFYDLEMSVLVTEPHVLPVQHQHDLEMY